MYDMLQAKVDRLARKLSFVQKNSKLPHLLTTFGYPEPQTVDIRSTFGVLLKSLGYNDSKELCGRLVASGAQIT